MRYQDHLLLVSKETYYSVKRDLVRTHKHTNTHAIPATIFRESKQSHFSNHVPLFRRKDFLWFLFIFTSIGMRVYVHVHGHVLVHFCVHAHVLVNVCVGILKGLCVCLRTGKCICICRCRCISAYLYVNVYERINAFVSVSAYLYANAHVSVPVLCLRTCMTLMHMYKYMQTHVCTYMCMHMRTHTSKSRHTHKVPFRHKVQQERPFWQCKAPLDIHQRSWPLFLTSCKSFRFARKFHLPRTSDSAGRFLWSSMTSPCHRKSGCSSGHHWRALSSLRETSPLEAHQKQNVHRKCAWWEIWACRSLSVLRRGLRLTRETPWIRSTHPSCRWNEQQSTVFP